MTVRERRYHKMKKMEKAYNNQAWICGCGHYEEWRSHCSKCGGEPPWGCDCSFCNDKVHEEHEYDFDLPF